MFEEGIKINFMVYNLHSCHSKQISSTVNSMIKQYEVWPVFLAKALSYLPTCVSKTLPQKSVFVITNKTPQRTSRVTKSSWVNHKTAAIAKLCCMNKFRFLASSQNVCRTRNWGVEEHNRVKNYQSLTPLYCFIPWYQLLWCTSCF